MNNLNGITLVAADFPKLYPYASVIAKTVVEQLQYEGINVDYRFGDWGRSEAEEAAWREIPDHERVRILTELGERWNRVRMALEDLDAALAAPDTTLRRAVAEAIAEVDPDDINAKERLYYLLLGTYNMLFTVARAAARIAVYRARERKA